MGSTATLADDGGGGSLGELREAACGLLRALAKGLRRSLGRAERGRMALENTAAPPGPRETRVIEAGGDLRDTRVLQGFQRRCERALVPGSQRVALDLEKAADANTRTIATLVTIVRRARSAGVPLELTVSGRVRGWITLYRLERMLHPECAEQPVVTKRRSAEITNRRP